MFGTKTSLRRDQKIVEEFFDRFLYGEKGQMLCCFSIDGFFSSNRLFPTAMEMFPENLDYLCEPLLCLC